LNPSGPNLVVMNASASFSVGITDSRYFRRSLDACSDRPRDDAGGAPETKFEHAR
jgi:hypothetical protein